jgi:uncharacterized membrane protein/glutaredoxin
MRISKTTIAIIILSVLGLITSAYLIAPYINNEAIEFCLSGSEGESGCDAVRNSEYAQFFRIKTPILGSIFYALILIWQVLKITTKKTTDKIASKIGFRPDAVVITFGLIFSAYLTYLEAFVINAWCFFCIIQAIISVSIFVLYAVYEKLNKGIIISSILIFILTLWINSSMKPGAHDDFAQCVTDSGAKMYGAYWCPHCKQQKATFGKSFKKIDYVECALPNNGVNPLCKKAGIEGYPTWIFADQEKVGGKLSLEKISEITNCKL